MGTLRSNSFVINGETIDVSDKDSTWRELLPGGGILSMSVSGSGVFKDAALDETLRAQAQAQTLDNYEMRSGNGDIWRGAFQVTSYERGGEHNGEETFSVSLESSGAITFVPGP